MANCKALTGSALKGLSKKYTESRSHDTDFFDS